MGVKCDMISENVELCITNYKGKILLGVERGDRMGKVISLFREGRYMAKQITIFDVANVFLNFESMSNKKLQKLCYYAQALYLAKFKKTLFNNTFQAWVHGPVCPELYKKYKGNKWLEISTSSKLVENITKEQQIFLKQIFDQYGKYDADELEYLTHQELPWKEARRGYEEWEPSNQVISESLMAKYYRNTDIFNQIFKMN